jgi:hypothetical protein
MKNFVLKNLYKIFTFTIFTSGSVYGAQLPAQETSKSLVPASAAPQPTPRVFSGSDPKLIRELNKPENLSALYACLEKEIEAERNARFFQKWSLALKTRFASISPWLNGFADYIKKGAMRGCLVACGGQLGNYYWADGSLKQMIYVVPGGFLVGGMLGGAYFSLFPKKCLFDLARTMYSDLSSVISTLKISQSVESLQTLEDASKMYYACLANRKSARKGINFLIKLASDSDSDFRKQCLDLWSLMCKQDEDLTAILKQLEDRAKSATLQKEAPKPKKE